MVQQKQDEYIKQLASIVDALATHNKMLEAQIAYKLALHLHPLIDFLGSLSLTLGSNIMP